MREVVNQIYEDVENTMDDIKLFLKLMHKMPDALEKLAIGTPYDIQLHKEIFICSFRNGGICVDNNVTFNFVYSPKTTFFTFKRDGLQNNRIEIYNANSDMESQYYYINPKKEYTEKYITYLIQTCGRDIAFGLVLAAYMLESDIDVIRFNTDGIHDLLKMILSDNYRSLLW